MCPGGLKGVKGVSLTWSFYFAKIFLSSLLISLLISKSELLSPSNDPL